MCSNIALPQFWEDRKEAFDSKESSEDFRISRELSEQVRPVISPCRERSPAQGVWQNKWRKTRQKRLKKLPKSDRKGRMWLNQTSFADLLLRHPGHSQSALWTPRRTWKGEIATNKRSQVPHWGGGSWRTFQAAANGRSTSCIWWKWRVRRQNPGPSWGQQKTRKSPFFGIWTHVLSGLKWLKMALSASGGLKWLKVA